MGCKETRLGVLFIGAARSVHEAGIGAVLSKQAAAHRNNRGQGDRTRLCLGYRRNQEVDGLALISMTDPINYIYHPIHRELFVASIYQSIDV